MEHPRDLWRRENGLIGNQVYLKRLNLTVERSGIGRSLKTGMRVEMVAW